MGKISTQLEQAREAAKRYPSAGARARAARVEKRFQRAMHRFIDKYYPRAAYLRQVKNSQLAAVDVGL